MSPPHGEWISVNPQEQLIDARSAWRTDNLAFWPRDTPKPLKPEWDKMGTRQIVPIAKGGWGNYSISEWDLRAASWQDFHPHSEYNMVLEGELYVAAGGDVKVLGPGDVARVPAGHMGRYWAPQYARMLGVYGPNPEGDASTGFEYWPLDAGAEIHPADPTSEDPLMHLPEFQGVEIWRVNPNRPDRPEWVGNRGRFITNSPQAGSWNDPILSTWELEHAAWTDRHPHTEFNFVVEGELIVESGGDRVILQAGDSVEIAAGQLARYCAQDYAQMVGVYGPNPHGLASSDFHYESI